MNQENTLAESAMRGGIVMKRSFKDNRNVTLFDLVKALGTVLEGDAAVGSAVSALVNSGAVRFRGQLAGRRVRITSEPCDTNKLAA